MLPRLEPEERLAKVDRLIVLGIGAVIFGAFAIDVLSNYSWIKAGALVMLLAWFALIVVHELGHALMAASLGWQVCRIVIGVGAPVARFRVWGVPIQISRYPVGGHVVPAPTSLAGARWKSVLVFAAGPAAELFVVAVILLVVGSDKLLAQPSDLWTLSAQAIAFAALVGAGFNLIPIPTREGQVTDGLGMLLSPSLPNAVFEEHLALPYTTQAESLLLAGHPQRAAAILHEGVGRLGDHLPARLALATALFEANAAESVVELLDPLIERTDVPNSLKPRLLALLALALVRMNSGRLEDADAYTAYACSLAPQHVFAKLARARVLLEQGQVHPAAALLKGLELAPFDDRVADARDVLLGLVELRRGQRDSARDLVHQLEARGARGADLDLLREELGIARPQSEKYA
jgi:hypothetical protein